jgi:hypothetical protein
VDAVNEHIPLLRVAKTSWLYDIYVPTYNRAGKAVFLNTMADAPPSVQQRITLVVRAEQAADYARAYPWAKQTIVKRPGLGAARMHAIRHARSLNLGRIVQIDDDIRSVSLLERLPREGKSDHTRRHSHTVSGRPRWDNYVRSLAVACQMSEAVFQLVPDAVMGSPRNGLFSGDVDPSVGAMIDKGGFPCAVIFYNLVTLPVSKLPQDFHMHGEDLATALAVLDAGLTWFMLPPVAQDADTGIETTIPLDPQSTVARQPDLDNAFKHYPNIAGFLRATLRNKLGGIMKLGINWQQWHAANGTEPAEIPLTHIINTIKENHVHRI